MGLFKQAARGLARRVARRVSRSELFEKPGERAPTPPLRVVPAAAPPTEVRAQGAAPSAGRSAAGRSASAPCEVADLDRLKSALGPAPRWRVVNHWATWCIPCVEEFPELLRLAGELGARAELLGVSWDLFDPRGDEDDIVEHVENFATGHALCWPSLLVGEAVPSETFFAAFAVDPQTVPQTWVIDPEGNVRQRFVGVLQNDDLERILALLPPLAGRGARGD